MKVQLLALASVLLGAASANPVHHPHHNHAVAARDDSDYWYAKMDHTGTARGYAPYAADPVYNNVFVSAKANDAQSVIDAINQGERQTKWLANDPRAVYVPPGTYEFDNNLWMRIDTILYGDAKNPPVFKPSGNFPKDHKFFIKGKDKAVGISGELSFSTGLKNIIIDISDFQANGQFTALDWSVAQNTHLQNIKIKLANHSGNDQNGQIGMQLERGSSLASTDVTIEGGQYGVWHNGHQQVVYKGFTFRDINVGVRISNGDVITILGSTFDTVGTAVLHDSGNPAINIVDCKSINSGVTFQSNGYPSVMIESLDLDKANQDIVQLTAHSYTLPPGTRVNTWSYGNTAPGSPIFREDTTTRARPVQVAPGGHLPLAPAPDYKDKSVSDFVNVKDKNSNGGVEILGDNTKDEADALQKVLNYAKDNGKIAYFPFGVYRVEKTLDIPVGLEVVGEVWSTISGQGDAFKNADQPAPVVRVGKANDVGIAKISDMHFTVGEICPGAIIVQVNAAGNNPADVGIWNSMITVGGTKGAEDIGTNCNDVNNECKAAYNGLHLSSSSSAYVENTWVWVADHQSENYQDGSKNNVRIAGKAGVRVEATKGTWLYGLGSEHWWFYSLGLINSQNVAIALLQAETNYDQGEGAGGNTQAPNPWTANTAEGDPTFSTCKSDTCRVGYAAWITGGSDIFLYGEGGYKFDAKQKYMNWIDSMPDNLQLFGIATHGSDDIIRLSKGNIISNDGFAGPWNAGLLGRYGPTNTY
ncbi:hypothetical protein KEM56_006052 [Ascosphaera pollenicola]|nr:hypothetical protein KEM56_006052 [Ascosphaera pollenicola]